MGCGILLSRSRDGKISVAGDPDHPVNRGKLCSKGMNLHHTVIDQSDRLLVPQMRDSRAHPLREVSWEVALQRAAAVFRSLIQRFGPDSVAFYVSGQCLTEEYYLANKMVKGFLGTNNIDTNSRLCMSSAVVAYKKALGEDSVPGCYEDVELADCWLVAGANPAWCHPILYRRLEERRGQGNPGRLIVVDPRRTQTAAEADLHLALRPGTDVALFRALARVLVEDGHADHEFLSRHTEGFEAFRGEVFRHTVEEYAQVCGLPEADVRKAARWIGNAKGFVSLWAMGLNQSTEGVAKNLGLINLHLITGQIGRPGTGPFSLTGQPNAMGGREVGGLSTLLPAHRNLADPQHRAEVAQAWGVPALSPHSGLTATEMVDALIDGRLKALWVICTNPLVSLPDLSRVEEALGKAAFVVVQDVSNRSDTLAYADLVLPAATWAEKTGTMTNSERRVSRLEALVPPPGKALPDTEILKRFAVQMGWGAAFDYASVSDIFDEHVRLTRGTGIDISGLSAARLRDEGTFQWPVPDAASKGTARLFTDGVFSRPRGRAQIVAPGPLAQPPELDPRFPLVLTTGRLRDQWHTMTRTGKVAKLGRHEPQAFLEIHPLDAQPRGLADGVLVCIESVRGRAVVRARVTDTVRPGTVFLPMHWGRLGTNRDARTNNLTEARVDPDSQQPELKYQGVEVTRHRPSPRRTIVVGAGAAAAALVRTLRAEGVGDSITVLSREPEPFYNRVLLPHYLEGAQTWDSLITLTTQEQRHLGLEVCASTAAVSVDRAARTVTDQHGVVRPYDVLVLATGSRAHRPSVPGGDLKGVLGLRCKADADALLAVLEPGRRLVVVGGGVLALEAAGAFHQKGWPVLLVHRSGRLMDRQLDETASRLLVEELADRGLPMTLHDEVRLIEGATSVTGVVLASGRRYEAGAVLYATGTTPEVALARDAGLLVNRGVVVDDQLRTSDPSILALGEIAEWQGQLWGITPAAEQQATVAARALAGDPFAQYAGSVPVNVLKVGGVDLACAGRLVSEHPRAEILIFSDEAQRTYKKVVVEDDRVVGCLLLGDKADFASLKELIISGVELGELRRTLLRAGKGPGTAGTGRLVCSCLGVKESTLTAVEASSVAALIEATGAGSGCGSCRPELARFCKPAVVV